MQTQRGIIEYAATLQNTWITTFNVDNTINVVTYFFYVFQ